jgi:RNA polymerase sigma-70 factor (ECF subfamily)
MWLDGREVIAVGRDPGDRPRYVIELELAGGRVRAIRDFRYVPYLLDDLDR